MRRIPRVRCLHSVCGEAKEPIPSLPANAGPPLVGAGLSACGVGGGGRGDLLLLLLLSGVRFWRAWRRSDLQAEHGCTIHMMGSASA